MSSGVGAQEEVSVVWGHLETCVFAWMERVWGLGAWVLVGFSPLPPSHPGYPMIPLTNCHLINPNELFSNFIIQHQELMREPPTGWLVVGASPRPWVVQRERGGPGRGSGRHLVERLQASPAGTGPGPDGRRG